MYIKYIRPLSQTFYIGFSSYKLIFVEKMKLESETFVSKN